MLTELAKATVAKVFRVMTRLVNLRVKICGITRPEQGEAIARLGANALGFICVQQSPRYVAPDQIQQIVQLLFEHFEEHQLPDRIGVFADAEFEQICRTVAIADLNGVQLHGQESPEFCRCLRQALPQVEVIKALRVRTLADLNQVKQYHSSIDTLLLDAYHPGLLGGTGKTLDWQSLATFQFQLPWFLAGGLTPANIQEALSRVQPSGIDLSSGVEHAPGDKDLDRVAQLFHCLQPLQSNSSPRSS
jgi:phosphoribosylanthranilate isomerase